MIGAMPSIHVFLQKKCDIYTIHRVCMGFVLVLNGIIFLKPVFVEIFQITPTTSCEGERSNVINQLMQCAVEGMLVPLHALYLTWAQFFEETSGSRGLCWLYTPAHRYIPPPTPSLPVSPSPSKNKYPAPVASTVVCSALRLYTRTLLRYVRLLLHGIL